MGGGKTEAAAVVRVVGRGAIVPPSHAGTGSVSQIASCRRLIPRVRPQIAARGASQPDDRGDGAAELPGESPKGEAPSRSRRSTVFATGAPGIDGDSLGPTTTRRWALGWCREDVTPRFAGSLPRSEPHEVGARVMLRSGRVSTPRIELYPNTPSALRLFDRIPLGILGRRGFPGWAHPTAIWLAARNFANWWAVGFAMVLGLMLARAFSRLGNHLRVDLLDRAESEALESLAEGQPVSRYVYALVLRALGQRAANS